MVLASPQFTPAQLIDAGRRAEAEGRLDLALQFYSHVAEHFAEAAEAVEARGALGRIGAAVRSWGTSPQAGAMRAQRHRPGAGRDRYRVGRALAFVVSVCGWLVALAGPVALYVLLGEGAAGVAQLGALPLAGGAAMLLMLGFAVVLVGQIARALFDQASATRDLLALERTRLGLD